MLRCRIKGTTPQCGQAALIAAGGPSLCSPLIRKHVYVPNLMRVRAADLRRSGPSGFKSSPDLRMVMSRDSAMITPSRELWSNSYGPCHFLGEMVSHAPGYET